jgi:hypothetical protein
MRAGLELEPSVRIGELFDYVLFHGADDVKLPQKSRRTIITRDSCKLCRNLPCAPLKFAAPVVPSL